MQVMSDVVQAGLYLRHGPAAQSERRLAPFADQAEVEAANRDEMARLVATGLIRGRTPQTLVPAGTTTRAEAVTLIKRLLDWEKQ